MIKRQVVINGEEVESCEHLTVHRADGGYRTPQRDTFIKTEVYLKYCSCTPFGKTNSKGLVIFCVHQIKSYKSISLHLIK